MASALTIKEYEIMFRRHYKFLCVVAFGVVKDQDAAEDIVQDFFLQLWQRRTEVTFLISFQAYATRAVKNLSISWLRKQPTLSGQVEDVLADEASLPEEEEMLLSTEDITAKVLEAAERLPPARKRIFLAFAIHRLSYAEIAEKNNISLNTVKTQMKKAYAFIRSQIADDTLGLILLSIIFFKKL
jgi:RNA polymerase sigma-70 factor (ECF subfamily)